MYGRSKKVLYSLSACFILSTLAGAGMGLVIVRRSFGRICIRLHLLATSLIHTLGGLSIRGVLGADRFNLEDSIRDLWLFW